MDVTTSTVMVRIDANENLCIILVLITVLILETILENAEYYCHSMAGERRRKGVAQNHLTNNMSPLNYKERKPEDSTS